MVLMVVGDPEKFDKPLSGYGEVKVVDIAIPDPPASEVIPEATPEALARGTELMKGGGRGPRRRAVAGGKERSHQDRYHRLNAPGRDGYRGRILDRFP